jgi:hypothetical protein
MRKKSSNTKVVVAQGSNPPPPGLTRLRSASAPVLPHMPPAGGFGERRHRVDDMWGHGLGVKVTICPKISFSEVGVPHLAKHPNFTTPTPPGAPREFLSGAAPGGVGVMPNRALVFRLYIYICKIHMSASCVVDRPLRAHAVRIYISLLFRLYIYICKILMNDF